MDAFQEANLRETLAGRIVLTIGVNTKSGDVSYASQEVKDRLDKLHLHKVKLADEVLILNVDGYIGESTGRELAFAVAHGKKVRFLDEKLGEEFLKDNAHALAAEVASFAFERDYIV
jgi:hypothetical protein